MTWTCDATVSVDEMECRKVTSRKWLVLVRFRRILVQVRKNPVELEPLSSAFSKWAWLTHSPTGLMWNGLLKLKLGRSAGKAWFAMSSGKHAINERMVLTICPSPRNGHVWRPFKSWGTFCPPGDNRLRSLSNTYYLLVVKIAKKLKRMNGQAW